MRFPWLKKRESINHAVRVFLSLVEWDDICPLGCMEPFLHSHNLKRIHDIECNRCHKKMIATDSSLEIKPQRIMAYVVCTVFKCDNNHKDIIYSDIDRTDIERLEAFEP